MKAKIFTLIIVIMASAGTVHASIFNEQSSTANKTIVVPVGDNLLKNSSFEEYSINTLLGTPVPEYNEWSVILFSTMVEENDKLDGDVSLHINPTIAGFLDQSVLLTDESYTAGTNFQLKVNFKVLNLPDEGYVSLDCYWEPAAGGDSEAMKAHEVDSLQRIIATNANSDWQSVTVITSKPEHSAIFRVRIKMSRNASVLFDDFSLVEIESQNPQIDVTPTNLPEFETIAGQQVKQSIHIKSKNCTDYVYLKVEHIQGAAFTIDNGVVAKNFESDVEITFFPKEDGEFQSTLTVYSEINEFDPIVISLKGVATPIVYYTLSAQIDNQEMGRVTGGGVYKENSLVSLKAIPNNGYHFVQWNDGIQNNPRTIELTQDTTFTAYFAIDTTGSCGKDYALKWAYDPSSKTLTISGNGSFDEHMECGIEAKQNMTNLVINEGVTAIGAEAFSGCANLATVQLPASLKTIGERAFYNCLDLTAIYNYRPNPCLIETNTFEKVNTFDCALYVLAGSENKYSSEASGWKIFYEIKTIGASETTTTGNEVTVNPNDNTVTLTWPVNSNAETYTIEITKDGAVFCTLIFNAAGQLTGIAFAPNRNGQAQAPAATMTASGMQFTVTGLNSGTKYGYSLTAKDAADQDIVSYSGDFTTTGVATGIDSPSLQGRSGEASKLLRDGQLLILHGNKIYTATGLEVK